MFDEGVLDYERAISIAKERRRPLVALRAFLFLAREMIRFDPKVGEEIYKIVDASFKKLERANIKAPIDLIPAYSPNPAPLAALGGFAARDVLYLGL